MSIQEIISEVETLPVDERRKLAAFLASLRHREISGYRELMARRIDDENPENWLTLEDLDQRLKG